MVAIIIHVVYFIVWFFINKIRNSKSAVIREWDNGNEFYESLSAKDKELYWKEDTKILNSFFIIFLFFLECTLISFFFNICIWLFILISGIVISCIVAIVMSLKLRSKYKKV